MKTDSGPASLFQIGDIAKKIGVSLRAIRYYEEEGLIEPTAVTPGGLRLYDARDVERLRFITTLRRLDMSLDDIKTVMGLNGPEPETRAGLIKRSLSALSLAQQKIDAQQDTLKELRKSIAAALESVEACLKCGRPSCQDCPQCVFIL